MTEVQSESLLNDVSNNHKLSNDSKFDTTLEEDLETYTKVDNLEEDPVKNDNTVYILVSFVSPEGIINCNIRALKIRNYKGKPAIFNSYEEADKAAKELQQTDKYFDIFVMTNGKWYAWDPDPSDRKYVQNEKFDNKKEQEVMDGINASVVEKQEKQLNQLNALVGKKKAMIDSSKSEHKKQKEEMIKQGLSEKNDNVDASANDTESATATKVVAKKPRTNDTIKERLRKRLEEKRKQEQSKPSELTQLKEKLNELNENKNLTQTVTENINKAKELLAKMKKQNSE